MDSSPAPAIDRKTIAAAQRRIAADVRRTPLWRLPGAALGLDVAELWLKLEQLQLGGSSKARGMFNRMRSLPIPAAGVVIASGGNAGIAVATAERALGVPCEVFLPELASRAKRQLLAERPGSRMVQYSDLPCEPFELSQAGPLRWRKLATVWGPCAAGLGVELRAAQA